MYELEITVKYKNTDGENIITKRIATPLNYREAVSLLHSATADYYTSNEETELKIAETEHDFMHEHGIPKWL